MLFAMFCRLSFATLPSLFHFGKPLNIFLLSSFRVVVTVLAVLIVSIVLTFSFVILKMRKANGQFVL